MKNVVQEVVMNLFVFVDHDLRDKISQKIFERLFVQIRIMIGQTIFQNSTSIKEEVSNSLMIKRRIRKAADASSSLVWRTSK